MAQSYSHAIVRMEASDQTREEILTQIRNTIKGFLQEFRSDSAIRVLGIISNRVLGSEEPLNSIKLFASEVQKCLTERHFTQRPSVARFLAVNLYPSTLYKYSYFVVDSNNFDYNYDTAHKCRSGIPVYVLRLSKRKPKIFRNVNLDMAIAGIIANMHEGHGNDSLPLCDDYNDPNRQYSNPRSLRS